MMTGAAPDRITYGTSGAISMWVNQLRHDTTGGPSPTNDGEIYLLDTIGASSADRIHIGGYNFNSGVRTRDGGVESFTDVSAGGFND